MLKLIRAFPLILITLHGYILKTWPAFIYLIKWGCSISASQPIQLFGSDLQGQHCYKLLPTMHVDYTTAGVNPGYLIPDPSPYY